ncbi:MAG: hypothetical protein MZV63_15995 [Marinilabiliales bacterium]|nr:hypothetical protein [Marinilabiliales bacterium]
MANTSSSKQGGSNASKSRRLTKPAMSSSTRQAVNRRERLPRCHAIQSTRKSVTMASSRWTASGSVLRADRNSVVPIRNDATLNGPRVTANGCGARTPRSRASAAPGA